MARRAEVVRAGTAAEAALGGDEYGIAPALDRLAKDLLRHTVRVAVGRVEPAAAGLEADVDHAPRLGDVRRAPRLEEFIAAAEGAGAERECRNHEARCAELP